MKLAILGVVLALGPSLTIFVKQGYAVEGNTIVNYSKLNSASREIIAQAQDSDEFEFLIRLRASGDVSLLDGFVSMGLRIDSRTGVILSARGSKAIIVSLLALDAVKRIELSRALGPESEIVSSSEL